MSKIKYIVFFSIVLSAAAFWGCDIIGGYDYYALNGTGAVASCRVFYPASLPSSNETYPAVTLSGGMTNTKEAMYWMAEYLAGQAGVVVFAISAQNNMTVGGYESAHRDGHKMMIEENRNARSPLYNKLKNFGLMGYSMGGGAVLNVAQEIGKGVSAVVSMAPFGPQMNLSRVSAGCLIMVGKNDIVAGPNWNAEPAYQALPNTIEKCLLEFRGFGHLAWVGVGGATQKELAGDWIDFTMNGNKTKRNMFKSPPMDVVQNWNNL